MKKTRFLIGAVCLILCVCLCFSVSALTVTQKPTDRFFINDFAGVISDADEQAIYEAGVQLYEKTKGAQVVAVTIDSLNGASVDEYAMQLGRQWGVGSDEKNDGIVLLLSVSDRKVSIQNGYGLEGAVTDAKSGRLLDLYAVPSFKQDDFSTGMAKTYDALVNEVYIEYGMEPDENYTPLSETEDDTPFFAIVVLIIFLLLFILPQFRRRGGPRFFFFPGAFRFGGGGFGSGFSGGSRSGGFGGFSGGGGSFGGGGASRGF